MYYPICNYKTNCLHIIQNKNEKIILSKYNSIEIINYGNFSSSDF